MADTMLIIQCTNKTKSGQIGWITKFIILILQLIIIFGCKNSQNTQQHEEAFEFVLSEGMEICAKTPNDAICISAIGGNKRSILWDGKNRSITLVPRKERWHGNLGLVSPDEPKNLWKSQSGITRVLIEEAQIRYDSVNSVLKTINFPGKEEYGYNVVYNDDGLLFIWHSSVSPEEKLLDLMVFQILINGEKPKSLPGSRNENITISYERRK